VPNLVAEGRLPITKENRIEPVSIPGFKFPLHTADLMLEFKDEDYIARSAYDCSFKCQDELVRPPSS